MINPQEEEDQEIMYNHGLIDNIEPKILKRITIILMILLIVVSIFVECK